MDSTPTRGGRLTRSTWLALGTVVALVLGVLIVAGWAGMDKLHKRGHAASADHNHQDLYSCPMHPEVRSHEPGECPICGMDLVKVESPSGAGPSATGAAEGLVPVHADAEAARLAGVRTVEAGPGSIAATVRAVGNVVPHEGRVRHVTTKVAGWIEKLHVNATGQMVRAGEPLFELYSPELLATQEEYVRALRTAEELSTSSLPEVRRGAEDLAVAARRRLELFDVPSSFVEQLRRTRQPTRTIVFRAPFGGYVSEKAVVEGHKVEPGADLMTITDLSRIWVTAQIYEAEASAARVGSPATVSLQYDPSVSLRGRVSLVYPTVDTETRTLQVRVEFANPGLVLKPGMFVNVELERARAGGLVVPDSAVIDTGTRQVVFVEAAPGHFEPREVKVGMRADGKAVLSAGIEAGERVAVAANFLLDSESRLRGAVSGPSAHEGH